jgi:hypothetical protein
MSTQTTERRSMAEWEQCGRERCTELGLDPDAEADVYVVEIHNVGHTYWRAHQWPDLVEDLKLHIDNSGDGATVTIERRSLEQWHLEGMREFEGY